MNETKFTEGEWELCDRGDYGDFDGNSNVILADDRRIAVVHNSCEEGEANAHLIKTAKKMYEALIDLMDAFEARMGDWENADWDEAYQKAQKATAEARGES